MASLALVSILSVSYGYVEIKHKIDLDASYFKLHLIIIKFPTLEILSEWVVVFLLSCTTFLEAFIYAARCSSFEIKRQFIFSN